LFLVLAGLSTFLKNQNLGSGKLCAWVEPKPYEDIRNRFDVTFCLAAILFILSGIEVTFLLPWSITSITVLKSSF
jgi:NADH:ubiquinone oxidoreductase subunit 3 (subunit A)